LLGKWLQNDPDPTSAASMISWMLALSPPLGDQLHRGADQRLPRPRLAPVQPVRRGHSPVYPLLASF
jgi:hypothetical protein